MPNMKLIGQREWSLWVQISLFVTLFPFRFFMTRAGYRGWPRLTICTLTRKDVYPCKEVPFGGWDVKYVSGIKFVDLYNHLLFECTEITNGIFDTSSFLWCSDWACSNVIPHCNTYGTNVIFDSQFFDDCGFAILCSNWFDCFLHSSVQQEAVTFCHVSFFFMRLLQNWLTCCSSYDVPW